MLHKVSVPVLRICQIGLLVALVMLWFVLTEFELAPSFFFGNPIVVVNRLYAWFATGTIYIHLWTTLVETLLSFGIGTILGLGMGMWLALNPFASALLDPYVKAANSMPRIILAPIFAMWFGLGIWSKVALAVTLVFFVVFFSVYHGVRDVSPVLISNARMMGATSRQLLRYVYIPSAASWVFSSLHASVGMAFVGAVVGEYLGSARGVGFLILQAEGVFDINTVIAGMILLTMFALILDGIVTIAERRFLAWRPSGHDAHRT